MCTRSISAGSTASSARASARGCIRRSSGSRGTVHAGTRRRPASSPSLCCAYAGATSVLRTPSSRRDSRKVAIEVDTPLTRGKKTSEIIKTCIGDPAQPKLRASVSAFDDGFATARRVARLRRVSSGSAPGTGTSPSMEPATRTSMSATLPGADPELTRSMLRPRSYVQRLTLPRHASGRLRDHRAIPHSRHWRHCCEQCSRVGGFVGHGRGGVARRDARVAAYMDVLVAAPRPCPTSPPTLMSGTFSSPLRRAAVPSPPQRESTRDIPVVHAHKFACRARVRPPYAQDRDTA